MATADLIVNGGPVPAADQKDPRWVNPPLVQKGEDYGSISDSICKINEQEVTETPAGWLFAFAISATLAGFFAALIGYLIIAGVGVWGNTSPIFWAFPIVNFVFWVGIGHAGTLISAILFIFRQNWRTSINRFSEAMTIFAVVCAGTFPGIHIGRVWFAYFLFPLPRRTCTCGPTSAVRFCGTCLRSALTRPYRWCSGTWA